MNQINNIKNEKEEIKLLIAKALDKYEFTRKSNNISYTDFCTGNEISLIKKELISKKINNYIIYGVKEDAERNVIIFYPEKLSEEMVIKNYNNIFKIIRIKMSKENPLEHRMILSGIMKTGIRREKFGDIIVDNDIADIICFDSTSKIILDGIKDLTRFKKSEIEILDISNLLKKEIEFDDVKIIISSNRLDNFVSEIAKTSRNKACELIDLGKVLVNNINEYKYSKKLNINDVITIRGKGKFIYEKDENKTRSNRQVILLKKYK